MPNVGALAAPLHDALQLLLNGVAHGTHPHPFSHHPIKTGDSPYVVDATHQPL